MAKDSTPLEEFRRVTATTMRAVSRKEVNVSFVPDGGSLLGSEARITVPARDLPAEDVSRVRGEADSMALKLRHHAEALHARHAPADATARAAYDAVEQVRYEALGSRTYELADFLVTVAKLDKLPGNFSGTVTYHDACSGLRELGVKAQPRALLAKLPGVTLREMNGAEECCGFGGTFSVKFGEVSARIAEKKCDNIRASGADAVVLGDLGCMLSIEGKLRRLGDEKMRVLHIAEILAGEQ